MLLGVNYKLQLLIPSHNYDADDSTAPKYGISALFPSKWALI